MSSCRMASLYYRGDAIWISFKGEDGQWKNKDTSYRKSNPGERFQAERVRDTQTLKEKLAHPVKRTGGWEWVGPWIYTTWAHSPRTQDTYQKYWRTLPLAHGYRSPFSGQCHPRALLELSQLETHRRRETQYQHS